MLVHFFSLLLNYCSRKKDRKFLYHLICPTCSKLLALYAFVNKYNESRFFLNINHHQNQNPGWNCNRNQHKWQSNWNEKLKKWCSNIEQTRNNIFSNRKVMMFRQKVIDYVSSNIKGTMLHAKGQRRWFRQQER